MLLGTFNDKIGKIAAIQVKLSKLEWYYYQKVPLPPVAIYGEKGVLNRFGVKDEKNQSCSKWPEIVRKLVEKVFFFSPNKRGVRNLFFDLQ